MVIRGVVGVVDIGGKLKYFVQQFSLRAKQAVITGPTFYTTSLEKIDMYV